MSFNQNDENTQGNDRVVENSSALQQYPTKDLEDWDEGEDNIEDDLEEISEMESAEMLDDLDNLDALISDTKKKEEEKIQPMDFERRPEAKTVQRQELIDDFIRNFFIKYNLTKSLDTFQVFYFVSKGIIDGVV